MLDTDKIRRLRKRLKLSQTAAAALAGFSGKSAWSNVETGLRPDISLRTLARIAEALQTKPKNLLK